MTIYLKAEDITDLFEYDYRLKTKVITIERWNNLLKNLSKKKEE